MPKCNVLIFVEWEKMQHQKSRYVFRNNVMPEQCLPFGSVNHIIICGKEKRRKQTVNSSNGYLYWNLNVMRILFYAMIWYSIKGHIVHDRSFIWANTMLVSRSHNDLSIHRIELENRIECKSRPIIHIHTETRIFLYIPEMLCTCTQQWDSHFSFLS